MISFSNITYKYPNGTGVFNVNMKILPGEFAFLIGPSGAGKTTIMKLIYMDLIPSQGEVIVKPIFIK